mmetsp:Transcript_111307/g.321859  ORF Transcript_111307/g.321859 Transcript_111307/m.321859 type:complete len:601 (-) Transcript_111307:512-2314(-)
MEASGGVAGHVLRPTRGAVVLVGDLPHRHWPLISEGLIVDEVHERCVSRPRPCDGPRELHGEAALAEEVAGHGRQGASQGVPGQDDLADDSARGVLRRVRLAPACLQGGNHFVLQLVLPSVEQALAEGAVRPTLVVVQLDLAPLIVHVRVRLVDGATKDHCARLGGNKVRRPGEVPGRPPKLGRVEKQRFGVAFVGAAHRDHRARHHVETRLGADAVLRRTRVLHSIRHPTAVAAVGQLAQGGEGLQCLHAEEVSRIIRLRLRYQGLILLPCRLRRMPRNRGLLLRLLGLQGQRGQDACVLQTLRVLGHLVEHVETQPSEAKALVVVQGAEVPTRGEGALADVLARQLIPWDLVDAAPGIRGIADLRHLCLYGRLVVRLDAPRLVLLAVWPARHTRLTVDDVEQGALFLSAEEAGQPLREGGVAEHRRVEQVGLAHRVPLLRELPRCDGRHGRTRGVPRNIHLATPGLAQELLQGLRDLVLDEMVVLVEALVHLATCALLHGHQLHVLVALAVCVVVDGATDGEQDALLHAASCTTRLHFCDVAEDSIRHLLVRMHNGAHEARYDLEVGRRTRGGGDAGHRHQAAGLRHGGVDAGLRAAI